MRPATRPRDHGEWHDQGRGNPRHAWPSPPRGRAQDGSLTFCSRSEMYATSLSRCPRRLPLPFSASACACLSSATLTLAVSFAGLSGSALFSVPRCVCVGLRLLDSGVSSVLLALLRMAFHLCLPQSPLSGAHSVPLSDLYLGLSTHPSSSICPQAELS